MITLPASAVPSSASPELLDFGLFQRPATGAEVTRIDRPGSRWRIAFGFAATDAETARVLVSRIAAARSEGLRMPMPLQRVSQDGTGTPLIDGAGAAGTALPLRGLTPGCLIKEGFWLSAIDAAGIHYLHNVRATVSAGSDGKAVLSVWPMLRAPLVDGNAVLIAKPLVEGLIEELSLPQLAPGGMMIGLGFTLEEAA